jgi:hypothetical protein
MEQDAQESKINELGVDNEHIQAALEAAKEEAENEPTGADFQSQWSSWTRS